MHCPECGVFSIFLSNAFISRILNFFPAAIEVDALYYDFTSGETAYNITYDSVANETELLIISGTGDVLEPESGIAAIGSGGVYAQSGALALKKHATHLTAEEMVREGLTIAADICIYTNHNFVIETI